MNRFGIAIAILIALAGCGNRPVGEAPIATAPAAQPGVNPPAQGTPVPDSRVDGSALPEGFPRKVWTESNGSALGVVAQEGGCGKASVEVTEQSASRVTLTLVETTPSEPRQCTMDIRFPELGVDLEKPLGDRTVVLRAEQRTA
ncbi:hypothetical protein [Actinokineospora sp. HUAS TT18]|uniref:hypothetical protein n=1 Tax=Actinokineospora sp. HUAS TT18 TaxID=3447451 RepID=UPI003F51B086